MKRERYTAHAQRGEGWWAIEVPDVPGVFSQARRIGQVEYMARDAIALMLDVEPDSFDVDVKLELPAEWQAWADKVRLARTSADEAERHAGATAREVARQLKAAGLPVRDVGAVLGVSPQRVSQLMNS